MKRILEWAGNHPGMAMALALVFSLGLSTGIVHLRIDASLAALISGEDPRIRYLENAVENFEEHPRILILIHSPDLFSPSVLASVKNFCDGIAGIPGVLQVNSLFNQTSPVNRRGYVYAEPLLPVVPANPPELAAKKRALLENGIVRGHLLNGRGDALAVMVSIEKEDSGGGNHTAILSRIGEKQEETFEKLPASVRVSISGVPVTKAAIWQRILWDILVLGPVSLLVIGAVIFLFYRSLAAVLLPILTGALSALATLGFMGYAGYSINVFLSIIIVLVVVLGCTEDLHILSEFRRHVGEGCNTRDAIRRTGESAGRPLLLTSGTTTLGFLSLALTDLSGLRAFAISCSFGMAANFLVTILLVPAVLALLPKGARSPSRIRSPLIERFGVILSRIQVRHRSSVIFVALLFLGVSAAGALRLRINSDYHRFCPRTGGPVEAHAFFKEHFGGGTMLLVVLETGASRGILEPGNFAALLRLQAYLDHEGANPFGYVTFVNESLRGLGKPLLDPSKPPAPAQLAGIASSLPPELFREFIDFDASRTAIRVQINAPESTETAAFEKRLDDFVKANLPTGLEVGVTGEKAIIDRLSDSVARKLFGNLVFLAVVTALLIALFAGSLKQGLLSMVPNLFPLAAIFGAMGWLDIPLALGTCPVALVAFGIAVDDTIHYLLRYKRERASGRSAKAAAEAALRHELHPIVATSAVIAGGFLVLMLSPAPINFDIALLFLISTAVALFADLLVMPLILGFETKERKTGTPPRMAEAFGDPRSRDRG